ncbi:hypothetical protein AU693_004559 [Salmonella enterica subsp. diarizonae]|nr:hypothetical protein [Salmonella enterica subsp. diarizonae]
MVYEAQKRKTNVIAETTSCYGNSYIPCITIHFVNTTSATGEPLITEVTEGSLSWQAINVNARILHAVTVPFIEYQEGYPAQSSVISFFVRK